MVNGSGCRISDSEEGGGSSVWWFFPFDLQRCPDVESRQSNYCSQTRRMHQADGLGSDAGNMLGRTQLLGTNAVMRAFSVPARTGLFPFRVTCSQGDFTQKPVQWFQSSTGSNDRATAKAYAR